MSLLSVRVRITALAVVAVAVVLLTGSVVLVGVQRRQMTTGVDTVLQQRADDIASILASARAFPGELAASGQEGFAQVLDASGRVLSSTPNLRGDPPVPLSYELGASQLVRTVEGLAVDDDSFRVLSRTIEAPQGDAVLHVGTTFDVVSESIAVLVGTLSAAVPLVVLVVGILVWWLVGRTLSPVEEIRAEVAGIGSSDLHRRVPQPEHDDEIGRLARTMNEMLSRLQDSIERQQRFVADASHELRSPLTRMHAEIDVSLGSPLGNERATLESLRDGVDDLERLLEDLLHLARSDGRFESLHIERVDLDDIVFREAEAVKAEGRILVDLAEVSAAQVDGDSRQLTRAIRNLVDNARRHAASTVWLSLAERDSIAELTVTDDGPGIPPGEAEMVFERFGRLDRSRTRTTGGVGLGLAITREIVERHGGSVALDPNHHAGARFVVTLPLP